ncbi:hypothetical protein GCM10023170_092180 [Phytohabitans houttuyneae]|uniref:Uncharacterized protein n=1 Tax=Phytohabitans houttuyneae TaxID=1076126 RepID=A0A6V8K6F8_9ACTN|nr:hypothetical protein Phou_015170 [Phytohabitans houttuyneae]
MDTQRTADRPAQNSSDGNFTWAADIAAVASAIATAHKAKTIGTAALSPSRYDQRYPQSDSTTVITKPV